MYSTPEWGTRCFLYHWIFPQALPHILSTSHLRSTNPSNFNFFFCFHWFLPFMCVSSDNTLYNFVCFLFRKIESSVSCFSFTIVSITCVFHFAKIEHIIYFLSVGTLDWGFLQLFLSIQHSSATNMLHMFLGHLCRAFSRNRRGIGGS